MTLRSSPKLKMLKEYTDASDQGTNWNPSREPPAYNQYNSGVWTAYELTKSTPLGNLI